MGEPDDGRASRRVRLRQPPARRGGAQMVVEKSKLDSAIGHTPHAEGTSFPLGPHDLSGRRQLQRVLEARDRRAVAALRSGGRSDARARDRFRSPGQSHLSLLAHLRARPHGRSALCVPCRWAVRSRPRAPIQPRQGAARSLRKVRGAPSGLEPPCGDRTGRQLRLCPEERRRRRECVSTGSTTARRARRSIER